MTLSHSPSVAPAAPGASRPRADQDHLWLHFTRHGDHTPGGRTPVIVRGEGAHVFDAAGRRYLDGLSGLFTVQIGHGRRELALAAARQAEQLAFFPLWGYAHPTAIELAERLVRYTPGDLNRVFFTVSGGEAVESALKLCKQFWRLTGKPEKHKIISRQVAYHGTTHGALSLTGIESIKKVFEPLVPGFVKVPNTDLYHAPEEYRNSPEQFGQAMADRVAETIEAEGPDTVAAVFVEPVQNAGGCLPPPPGYLHRLREICDDHDVLLVSDEVICAFGRIGSMFACTDFDLVPDVITCAKGITSGYSPLGAMIVHERLFEPFRDGAATFLHGYTFGGHPVSTAVALANLDIFEREHLTDHVHALAPAFRNTLERLLDLPIVGDIRGAGFFYGIELVKDRATREGFTAEECHRVLRGFLSQALFEAGLHCRADDRGAPVIQLAPPLIVGQPEFDTMERILRQVLTEAWTLL